MSEYRNPNTHCLICRKAIYKRPSQVTLNKGRVFCSKVCHGISQRNEKPCIVCSKPILASLHKKTCSRSCANTNRAGNTYRTGRRKDNVIYQRGLKLRLLEDRGHECERCQYGKIEILQVHHKDRNRKNNTLSNLALICPNCHAEEHYLEKSWLSGKVFH